MRRKTLSLAVAALLAVTSFVAWFSAPTVRGADGDAVALTGSPTSAYTKCDLILAGKNAAAKTVALQLDIALDHANLNPLVEDLFDQGILEDPGVIGNEADYFDYLNNLTPGDLSGVDPDAILPPITFSCDFDAEGIGSISPMSGDIVAASIEGIGASIPIGTYAWTLAGDGLTYTLFGTLLRGVYYAQNVGAKQDMTLTADGDFSAYGDITIQNTDGRIKFLFPAPGDDDTDAPAQYSVVKTASYTDGLSYIDYTIVASASDAGYLDGKWITDALPSGLEIVSATVALNDAAAKDIPEASLTDDALSYEFADDTPDVADITKAVFTLRAQLTAEQMQAYMGSMEGFTPSFDNTATLSRDEAGVSAVASSGAVTRAMSLPPFFGKNGEQVAGNARQYKWTIDVNTYGSAPLTFIVDSLDTRAHRYDESLGVRLTIDDRGGIGQPTTKTLAIKKLSSSALAPYASLTNAEVKALYDQDPSPFDDILASLGSDECALYAVGDKAVLVIPFSGYLNKDVAITYYTNITPLPGEEAEGVSFRNDAKLLWTGYEYGRGGGPGYWEQIPFDFSIGKEVEVNTQVVTKSGGGYDADTQVMTWNFTINAYRVGMSGLMIEDTLEDVKQRFLLATPGDLVLTGSGGAANKFVPYLDAAPFSGDYYTLDTSVPGKTTFRLHLEDVADTDQYAMSLTTKLVDPAYVGANAKNATLTNAARILATTTNGQPFAHNATGQCTIDNALLNKSCLNDYNYNAHTLGWALDVNVNRVPIKGAKLLDTLPTGTYLDAGDMIFATSTNASGIPTQASAMLIASGTDQLAATFPAGTFRFGGDVTIVVTRDVREPSGHQYLANTMEFSFGDSGDVLDEAFAFAYKTRFEETYRANEFVTKPANDARPAAERLSIKNTCAFVSPSSVYDASVTQSASAAYGTLIEPMTKNGRYEKLTAATAAAPPYVDAAKDGIAVLHWSVLVNLNAVDRKDWAFSDDLEDFFELDKGSVAIYAPTLNDSGDVVNPNAAIATLAVPGQFADLSATYSKLSFTIPDAYKTTPLLVEFFAYVVDTAAKDAMFNAAALAAPGETPMLTDNAKDASAQSFDLSQYAKGSVAPYLTVFKKSSTPASPGGSNYLVLPGAQFELVECDASGVPTAGTEKVKVTNLKGKATFMFLKKNIVYRLTETQAPDSYALNDTPRYYYFKDEINPGTPPVSIGGCPVTTIVKDANLGYGRTVDIPNDPDGSGAKLIVLKLSSATDAPVSGVRFTLTAAGGFTRTFDTLQQGRAVFDNLDANVEYTLTEISAPLAYQPAGPWKFKATYSGGAYVWATTPVLATMSDDLGEAFAIPNDYQSAAVTLKKVRTGTTTPLSGVVFTIYPKSSATPVAYLSEGGALGTYQLSATAAGQANLTGKATADGIAYLRGAPGNYKLLGGEYYCVETVTPADYVPDAAQYPFTVKNQALYLRKNTTDAGATDASTTFGNDLSSAGAFSLLKHTPDGEPVKGIEFMLKTTPGGAVVATATSDAQGRVAFTGLAIGQYTLSEALPTGAHFKSPAPGPWTVTIAHTQATGFTAIVGTIASDTNGRFPVQNDYDTCLNDLILHLVEKDASPTDKPLSGALFAIYVGGTNVPVAYMVETATPGEYALNITGGSTPAAKNAYGSSYVQSGKLILGDYEFRQIAAPPGYLIDGNTYFFSVTSASLLFLSNDPLNPASTDVNGLFVNEPAPPPFSGLPGGSSDAGGFTAPVVPVAPSMPVPPALPEGSTPPVVVKQTGDFIESHAAVPVPSLPPQDVVVVQVINPNGVPLSDLVPPQKPGYRFDGWYTDPEMTTPYVPKDGIMPHGNLTLYPKFTLLDENAAYPGGSPRTGDSFPLWQLAVLAAASLLGACTGLWLLRRKAAKPQE